MKHKWVPVSNSKVSSPSGHDETQNWRVCAYIQGGCSMHASIKSLNWERVRDSECIGSAASKPDPKQQTSTWCGPQSTTVPAAPEVVVRPGDKVTHGVQSNTYTVVSCQDYMQNGGRKKPPPGAILVKSNISGIYFNWRYNRSTFLNGKLVTQYEDTSYGLNPPAPIADPVAEFAPKLEHRELNQDDDGMVIGWDGRKVWL